jgi:hypothetical protein
MLETYGLLSAIEGLDAALKAANVTVRSFNYVSGGLIAWFVEGEVGAVRVAVSAGKAAALRVGDVVGDHVIARPAKDVVDTLPPPGRPGGRKRGTGIHKRDFPAKARPVPAATPAPADEQPAADEQPVVEQPAVDEQVTATTEQPAATPAPAAEQPTDDGGDARLYAREELEALNVYELRAIARQTKGIQLIRAEIRDAKKSTLVDSILDAQNGENGAGR